MNQTIDSWRNPAPSVGIISVAMESTGVYWVPLFEIREARGFELFLTW